eukprot:COSAG02_NODE_22474_length_751_cov_1.529141_1_plen_55_part_10
MDSTKPLFVFLGLTISRHVRASIDPITVSIELAGEGADTVALATGKIGADAVTVY